MAPLSDSDSMRRKRRTHFSGPKRLPESALRDDAELEPLLPGGSRRTRLPGRESDGLSTNREGVGWLNHQSQGRVGRRSRGVERRTQLRPT